MGAEVTTTEIVPAEFVEHETAAVALWGTNDPLQMTARMSAVADAMASAVRSRGMAVQIGQNQYVKAEGWSLVGAMIGVFPRPREVVEIREDGTLVGFRATVELVTRDGGVVGGAVALCTVGEERWADRDWNQIASMAQTRATAKAYRQTLGFIMPMAGYAATPLEEMDGITPQQNGRRAAPRAPQARAQGPSDERLGQFANIGEFLTKTTSLGYSREQVYSAADLPPRSSPNALLDYPGGLDALFALITDAGAGPDDEQPF
jgi:hypothetical protein